MGEYCSNYKGGGQEKFHCLQDFDAGLTSSIIRDGQIRNEIRKRTFVQMTEDQMFGINREVAEHAAKIYEASRRKKKDIDFENFRLAYVKNCNNNLIIAPPSMIAGLCFISI